VRSLREDRVWLAEDAEGESHIFKIPPRDARVDESIAAAFVREAWNASRFGDTEFFPTARIPESATCRGYVQEFIDAPTLRKVMKQRRLKVEEAVALGCFLLKAQSFLLGNDLAHGDVKPGNILMKAQEDETLRFTLLDLGSAVEVFSTPGRAGTATFLAPERFGGAPITERTEIFSIGVTLYEALCGTPPYGLIERFQTPRYSTPKRPSQLNPAIPPWLESVLLRSISTNANERQQNYSEMLFELEHPASVQAFHRKGAPLLERNPVAFFRNALWESIAVNILLLARCHAS
jgi:serine/threonine protein kinase